MEVNLTQLESEYVTGKMSVKKLAEKHGISVSTARYHCEKNEWVKKRKKYQQKVVKNISQKAAEKEAKKLAKLQQCSDELDELINSFLKTAKKAEQALNVAELNLLSNTLKTAVAAKKEAYDILSEVQREKIQLDKDKVKIEKDRLKWEKEKAQVNKTDNSITVVLKGEIEGYAE
jgi:predicted adenine nucleotide alpha hydrolase (AANH) superfamily ATPase